MVRKKYTWRKMDAIFMYWPQFEQLVRDRLQSVLSRNVQLHIFEDKDSCGRHIPGRYARVSPQWCPKRPETNWRFTKRV